MLNTDVELVYDIDVDNYGAGTTCTIPNSCPEAATKSLVEAYANVSQEDVYCAVTFKRPLLPLQ